MSAQTHRHAGTEVALLTLNEARLRRKQCRSGGVSVWVCAQSITNHASTPSRARLSALSTASFVGFIAQLNSKSTQNQLKLNSNSTRCSAVPLNAWGHRRRVRRRRTPAAAASVSAESPASWMCTVEHATGVPATRTRHSRSERARAHRDASPPLWANAVPRRRAPQRTAAARALRPFLAA
jgi:hypothetical protein